MREDTQVQMHKNEAQYKGNDPADFVWKKLLPVIKFGFCWDLNLSLARNERHLFRRISHGLYSNLVTRSQFYFIRAHVKSF